MITRKNLTTTDYERMLREIKEVKRNLTDIIMTCRTIPQQDKTRTIIKKVNILCAEIEQEYEEYKQSNAVKHA